MSILTEPIQKNHPSKESKSNEKWLCLVLPEMVDNKNSFNQAVNIGIYDETSIFGLIQRKMINLSYFEQRLFILTRYQNIKTFH
jgi:hypothetical protein